MINNTHYNLIDTLVFALGQYKWDRYCACLIPFIKTFHKNVSRQDALKALEEVFLEEVFPERVTFPVIGVFYDCLNWALNEGDLYGISRKVSEDCGLVFRV
jgi:hypothetical protein